MVTPRVHDVVRTQDGWWAVVRRERVAGGVPIGVRGAGRAERHALVVDQSEIASVVTPEDAAKRTARRAHHVFDALRSVQASAAQLGLAFGAAGGCGYELVTGEPVLHEQSDLDLILRAPFDDTRLERLAAALRGSTVRIDVEVLFEDCGAALEEIVRGGSFLVKTPDGPRLQ